MTVFECEKGKCGASGYIYSLSARSDGGGCDTCGYGRSEYIEISRDCAVCRKHCGRVEKETHDYKVLNCNGNLAEFFEEEGGK